MRFLRICIVLGTLYLCRPGYSQLPANLQILQATYGADSTQIDVTAKLKSLVEAGESIQVSNALVDSDPAFGKVKTLTIVYMENGQEKTETAQEGETVTYISPTNAASNAPNTRQQGFVTITQSVSVSIQGNNSSRVDTGLRFQATCTVVQGVSGGSIVEKVYGLKEGLVKRAGRYDPLGNMGRGRQTYYREKGLQRVLISKRAFVAGLRDTAEGNKWEGVLYPVAEMYEYTDVRGATHRIEQFATPTTVVLPAGTRVEFVSQDGSDIYIRYEGGEYAIPISATDLK